MNNGIECGNLCCTRPADQPNGPGAVRDFSATFSRGEFVGFCGPDGCGKGLLLNLIGLIERADRGRLDLFGNDVCGFSSEAFARALIHEPRVLIAISPPATALLPLARLAADQSGLTVLWSGGRDELEPFADRIIEMREGCALP